MLSLFKQKDLSKKILLPELSATYCFALLKAKAKETNFDPKNYLPEECFKENNNNLVMPYHLNHMLDELNLKLSDVEYHKLWQRFDLNNIGGVKTRIFLRLIDYNRNQLDEISNDADILRTKSCIVDLSKSAKSFSSLSTARLAKSTNSKKSYKSTSKSYSLNDQESNLVNEETQNEIQVESLENNSFSSISTITTSDLVPSDIKTNETNILINKKQNTNSACKSTLSEAKIKSMVHLLKNANKFGPSDDLTVFLNNKVSLLNTTLKINTKTNQNFPVKRRLYIT